MKDVSLEYTLSKYEEIKTISQDKVFIVNYTLDDVIYIKKILDKNYEKIYKILKENKNKNRVNVIDNFLYEDKLIVIEEFVSGKTIGNILKYRAFKEDEAIDIISSICDGLADLHSMNNEIVHRDIKPDNIIISNDGIIKIIDFDASRYVDNDKERDTKLLGTKQYASPEHFGFAQTDRRSDIYSIGVLLNYMLIRDYPKNKIYTGINGCLGDIIKKAISIDRDNRYYNVIEFKEALNNYKKSRGNQIVYKEEVKFKECENVSNEKSKIKVFNNREELMEYNLIKEKENKKEIKDTNKIKLKNIVGFRSGNILKSSAIVFWYIIAIFGFSQFFYGFKRIDLVLSIYMMILPEIVLGNFFGFGDKIPYYNSKLKRNKLISRGFVLFISFLIAGSIM